jgi:acetolactate synthase-1/2/3 large subunit
MLENGIEPEGVKPSAPDFLKIAEAYGLPAKRLSHVDEFGPALTEMWRHAGPSLIEIHQTETVGATA